MCAANNNVLMIFWFSHKRGSLVATVSYKYLTMWRGIFFKEEKSCDRHERQIIIVVRIPFFSFDCRATWMKSKQLNWIWKTKELIANKFLEGMKVLSILSTQFSNDNNAKWEEVRALFFFQGNAESDGRRIQRLFDLFCRRQTQNCKQTTGLAQRMYQRCLQLDHAHPADNKVVIIIHECYLVQFGFSWSLL